MPSWPWNSSARPAPETSDKESLGGEPIDQARESLHALVKDARVPERVRAALANEFEQVQSMLDKLEQGHIHIAVFGRVSVGKSALLNALLGRLVFSTSPLHGETKDARLASWEEYDAGGVYLIDTPGLDEIDGEKRERLAREVAERSDLVLFVVEGDITETELAALRQLASEGRPILLVLNKIDRYTREDRELLLTTLRERTQDLLPPDRVLATAAAPAERIYVEIDPQGQERECVRQPPPDVEDLRDRLWTILESEGETLAALNATLFAGKLSDRLSQRVVAIKKDLGDRVVKNYCLAKGVVVGLNPVPITDILAAAAVDVSLVVHLSRIYSLPISRHEASDLLKTIGAQMLMLTGTVWAVHFISSALKGASLGLSTVITAAAQGAVAYYATFIVGEAAHRYFEQGKSWGKHGPKRVVRDILDNVDRESLLAHARDDILNRIRPTQS